MGPDQPQLSFEALKATIQKMVKDEKVFLAFIGSDVELQNQLAETLANVPNTRVCTFAEHKDCTELLQLFHWFMLAAETLSNPLVLQSFQLLSLWQRLPIRQTNMKSKKNGRR